MSARMGQPLVSAWRFVLAVHARATAAHLPLIAGGAAFSGLLALFPGLAALIALTSFMTDPDVVLRDLELLKGVVPDAVFALLELRIRAFLKATGQGVSWAALLSVAASLFSARAGVSSIIQGVEAVSGGSKLAGWESWLRALVLTVVLVTVGVLALAAGVLLPLLVAAVDVYWPGRISGISEWRWIAWAIMLSASFVGLNLLYRFGSGRMRQPWFSPGAVFTMIFWIAGSYAVGLYVQLAPSLNEVYGSLSAVVALQLWLYLTALMTLVGAAIDAEWYGRQKLSYDFLDQ